MQREVIGPNSEISLIVLVNWMSKKPKFPQLVDRVHEVHTAAEPFQEVKRLELLNGSTARLIANCRRL